MAMILITHDLGVVAGHTDRVAVMYAGRLAETAVTRAIFHETEHRYTAALLDSTPRVDIPVHSKLRVIGGEPPDLRSVAPGCRFAPRCGFALPECSEITPPLESHSEGHLVACHNPVSGRETHEEVPT